MTDEVEENILNNYDDVAQAEDHAGGDRDVSLRIENPQPRENFLEYKIRSIKKKYHKSEEDIRFEEREDEDDYPRNLNPFSKDLYPSDLNPFNKSDYPSELNPFNKDDYPSALNPFEKTNETNKTDDVCIAENQVLNIQPSEAHCENTGNSIEYRITSTNTEPQQQQAQKKYHIVRPAPSPPHISPVNSEDKDSKKKYNIVRPAPAPPNISTMQDAVMTPSVSESRPSTNTSTLQEQVNHSYRITRPAPSVPDNSSREASVSYFVFTLFEIVNVSFLEYFKLCLSQ